MAGALWLIGSTGLACFVGWGQFLIALPLLGLRQPFPTRIARVHVLVSRSGACCTGRNRTEGCSTTPGPGTGRAAMPSDRLLPGCSRARGLERLDRAASLSHGPSLCGWRAWPGSAVRSMMIAYFRRFPGLDNPARKGSGLAPGGVIPVRVSPPLQGLPLPGGQNSSLRLAIEGPGGSVFWPVRIDALVEQRPGRYRAKVTGNDGSGCFQ